MTVCSASCSFPAFRDIGSSSFRLACRSSDIESRVVCAEWTSRRFFVMSESSSFKPSITLVRAVAAACLLGLWFDFDSVKLSIGSARLTIASCTNFFRGRPLLFPAAFDAFGAAESSAEAFLTTSVAPMAGSRTSCPSCTAVFAEPLLFIAQLEAGPSVVATCSSVALAGLPRFFTTTRVLRKLSSSVLLLLLLPGSSSIASNCRRGLAFRAPTGFAWKASVYLAWPRGSSPPAPGPRLPCDFLRFAGGSLDGERSLCGGGAGGGAPKEKPKLVAKLRTLFVGCQWTTRAQVRRWCGVVRTQLRAVSEYAVLSCRLLIVSGTT